LLLIVCLNWFGFLTIEQTFAYYNDTESSLANSYSAATLDFAISETSDFSPEITPNQNTTREIDLENLGSLDFEYRVKVENATGTLCNYLLLKDDLTGDFRPLSNFVSATTTFSNKSNWQFEAKLTSNDPSLQNKTCVFDFLFDGWQIEGAGFSDKETIVNTIHSGVWRKIVINKVYYDVDSQYQHGNENDNEWVELYNQGSEAIDLSGWQICDNDSCDTLSGTILANNFALITKSGTTWNYWQIFSDVLKIELGDRIGNGLNDNADMLLLEDKNGLIVDQMNWGTPDSNWPNYNSNLWQSGLVPSGEGRIAARVPSGQDTDSPSDWQNLELPIISEIEVSPLQGTYCGCCNDEAALQSSCSTAWHCAPGLYYSQELTITWTATTNNPSGSDNLSIDIVYITDNDCSGNISNGDSSYIIAENEPNDGTFTWSGWTNPKEFFDDLINGEDTHLWKDKDGKKVPYFYGLTWFRITATGPENFMINNSKTSRAMFEPLPPGVSLEELCALEGTVSNSCSLCQQIPRKENSNSNDNDKDNDKEEEKPITNENHSPSAASTTDIFEEEIKNDEIDDEEIIDGLPIIKEMPTSTDEMSEDSLEDDEENLENEQSTSVEEVDSENSGQSEGETIEDDFESLSQETNLEEATTTPESETVDSENEIIDSENEVIDSESEIIESEKENEAGEEVVDEEADDRKENDNQDEKENNDEEKNNDEGVNNNQTEVSQEEQADNKEADDGEQSEMEKEENSNQGEEETEIKSESQPPIKEEESTDLDNSETDEGEKENESDNQQQDSQTEPEAKTDDSLNTSSELPNS
ncbi:lamin tail domain-containing protein, partial [Candidatus Calescamantes bacterium]|nr:lamin tail domain-containing protein [Candidatus Calescamantes bacterium]